MNDAKRTETDASLRAGAMKAPANDAQLPPLRLLEASSHIWHLNRADVLAISVGKANYYLQP